MLTVRHFGAGRFSAVRRVMRVAGLLFLLLSGLVGLATFCLRDALVRSPMPHYPWVRGPKARAAGATLVRLTSLHHSGCGCVRCRKIS